MSYELSDPAEAGAIDALESRTAGSRIVRGGAMRGAGYMVGTGALALAFAVLLRHLGVVDFGRYSTVIALVAIATGLADAGLTVGGQRLYTAANSDSERHAVLRDLLGARVLFAPVAVAAMAVFALFAGYDATMVAGVVMAGVGSMIAITALTISLPLTVELRFGRVAGLELSRHLTIAVGIVVLAAAGVALGAFFWAYLAAGIVTGALAVVFTGRRAFVRPHMSWASWLRIVREVGPLAVAMAVNAFYLRVLIVLASLLATGEELGLFATAARITEVLVGVPMYILGAAFPLLAHAGVRDSERLRYALQRLSEVALLVAGLFVVVLELGAEPIVHAFAGGGFEDVVEVLRWQALGLFGASMTQAWILGIVAVEAQRSLIWVNVVGFLSAAVLGAVLIPAHGAVGASIAAALGEFVLAVAALAALIRARADLRPSAHVAPRVGIALAAGLAIWASPLPPVAEGAIGAVVYLGMCLLLRAVPKEVTQAIGARGSKRFA